jgi:hypothetical protein
MNEILEDTTRHFWNLSKKIGKNFKILLVVEFAMNSWNAKINHTPFMLNCGQNPDDPTIAWLQKRNPAVNKLVVAGLSNEFEQENFSEQHRISTSNMQILNGQIHQFIDQVMRYFLKRSIFA